MKMVIVGGGKVGENICENFVDHADIVLIDYNPDVVEEMFSDFDIQAVVGNGVDIKIQKEANVDEADIFIALTTNDEVNIIACSLAHQLGAKHTIARVRNPVYFESIDFIKASLGIEYIVNPERLAAVTIDQIIKFPMASSIETFGKGKAKIIEYLVEGYESFIGKSLIEVGEKYTDKILVVIIDRNGDITIPKGTDKILKGDRIFITGTSDSIRNFLGYADIEKNKIESVLIIGGGKISYYLVDLLMKRNIYTKLIEVDRNRAEYLAAEFPRLKVIHDDGTEQSTLRDEGIEYFDSVVSLTGIDEENIMISLYAKSLGVEKNITKVNRPAMLRLINHMDLDTIITPQDLIADRVSHFARSLYNTRNTGIQRFRHLAYGEVEALEFKVYEDCKITSEKLKNIKFKDGTIISLIIRDGILIFPGGEDQVQAGDSVVVISKNPNIINLDSFIEEVYG